MWMGFSMKHPSIFMCTSVPSSESFVLKKYNAYLRSDIDFLSFLAHHVLDLTIYDLWWFCNRKKTQLTCKINNKNKTTRKYIALCNCPCKLFQGIDVPTCCCVTGYFCACSFCSWILLDGTLPCTDHKTERTTEQSDAFRFCMIGINAVKERACMYCG